MKYLFSMTLGLVLLANASANVDCSIYFTQTHEGIQTINGLKQNETKVLRDFLKSKGYQVVNADQPHDSSLDVVSTNAGIEVFFIGRFSNAKGSHQNSVGAARGGLGLGKHFEVRRREKAFRRFMNDLNESIPSCPSE